MCSLKRSLRQGEIYLTTFVRFSTKSRMHIKGKNFCKSHTCRVCEENTYDGLVEVM